MPTKEYYQAHKEELNAKDREKYKNNKEYARQKNRNWRKNNPDKVKEQKKRYSKTHRNIINAKNIRYQKNNSKRVADYIKKWRKENPDKVNATRRRHLLKSLYGITENIYNQILKDQDEKCAICKNPKTSNKSFAVDHDHVTNKIRGLLCDRCNRGIGLFHDDVSILKNAIHYLSQG